MTEQTEELLRECKKAGYEFVTVFCADERVPESVAIKKSGSSYWSCPPKLVCAWPDLRAHDPVRGRGEWPKIWMIIRDLGLNHGGAGTGNCFPVSKAALCSLTAGCYDLSEVA